MTENVCGMSHENVAKYVVAGTKCPWQRVEVVFLFSKMYGGRSVCAAAQVPSRFYTTCLQKNSRGKLKMYSPEDFQQLQHLHLRWILQSDGTKLSVVGKKHWALDALKTRPSASIATTADSTAEEPTTGFYDWDSMVHKGGEWFCYAAVDCGSSLAEWQFREDIDGVVENALEAGVQKFVLKGSSVRKAERAKHLVSLYPNLMGFSAGLHPEFIGGWREDTLADLHQLVSEPACVAVGECGLDLSSPSADASKQADLLKLQLKLAHEFGKPALVCERNAKDELLEVLSSCKDGLPTLAVCSNSPTEEFIDLMIYNGHYVIITGIWWFGTGSGSECGNSRLHSWLSRAERWQLDHLLLASNAPKDLLSFASIDGWAERTALKDLTGKAKTWYRRLSYQSFQWNIKMHESRNEPCCIPVLIELLAKSLNMPPKDVAEMFLENSKRFFGSGPKCEDPQEKVKDEENLQLWMWEQTKFWLPWAMSVVVIYNCVWYVCNAASRFI